MIHSEASFLYKELPSCLEKIDRANGEKIQLRVQSDKLFDEV